MDPWVTPKYRLHYLDLLVFITTDCVLPIRYDSNQESAWPVTPNLSDNHEINVLWSMVLNAADKPSNTSRTHVLL